ncbi:MAG: flagellar basal body P-ring protein FlgI [Planctomycetes bacterium]|nr:flagellar basal body P-ring protein FlgI [Planctomycetota bacterium]
MNKRRRKFAYIIATLAIGLLGIGCAEKQPPNVKIIIPQTNITKDTTIGSLVEVFSPTVIPVEGYSIVGGLDGTGSGQCPPQVRAYLQGYLLSKQQDLNIEKFITSKNTAVVIVQGLMPTTGEKNQRFDVKITALSGTQTTSIKGGWLYGANLKSPGTFTITTRILADAAGPVFINELGQENVNPKTGYILGGARVLEEYKIKLVLRKPNFKISSAIRNRLNELFGTEMANAVSESQIELKVPQKYKGKKQKFIEIVKATYLTESPLQTQERISWFVRKMATEPYKKQSETALEAIGKKSTEKLSALLNSSSEQIRFHAARCMLNLGDDRGLDTLREIAADKNSVYRMGAIEAIGEAAKKNDAVAMARNLLNDDNFNVVLAGYEQLRKLNDIAIKEEVIARSFSLEQVAAGRNKMIFAARSQRPKIVLFGAPLYCRDDVFVQSPDGNITINAPQGQNYISIIRKHPTKQNVVAQAKSSFEISDLIRKLCQEPLEAKQIGNGGLGVTYDDVIAILKQMCEKGAVQAEFKLGPLSEIDLIVKR